jgi:hypothetical protein
MSVKVFEGATKVSTTRSTWERPGDGSAAAGADVLTAILHSSQLGNFSA